MIEWSYMRERRAVESAARRSNVAAALAFVVVLAGVIAERFA